MPLQSIPLGAPSLIEQNVVYALPSVLVQVAGNLALEASIDQVAWAALATDTVTSKPFIRCTVGNAIVIAKAAFRIEGGGGTPIGPTTDLVVNSVGAAGYLAVGTNPAQTGVIRIPNQQPIKSRNAAGTADLDVLKVDNFNGTVVGHFGNQVHMQGLLNANNGFSIQGGGTFSSSSALLLTGGGSHVIMDKRTAAPVAAANRGQLYVDDNGAGKLRLMALFPTGAAVQIAIEP